MCRIENDGGVNAVKALGRESRLHQEMICKLRDIRHANQIRGPPVRKGDDQHSSCVEVHVRNRGTIVLAAISLLPEG